MKIFSHGSTSSGLYSYLLHYDPTQAVRNKDERKILRKLSEIHIKDDFDVLQAAT